MNSYDIIKKLNEIREIVTAFKKTSIRYHSSHNYYKDNLKRIHLNMRGFLLKTQKNVEGPIKEIHNFFSIFLNIKNPTSKDCDTLIDELDLKIQDIEVYFEEDFSERIYDKGSRFDFYLDVKSILNNPKKDLFIIDSWINEDLLELYLKNLPIKLKIRILTGDKPKGKLVKIVNMFNSQNGNSLEIRENQLVHDRGIFSDSDQGWVMGQSIKDGAKKPTYIIKLKDPTKLKEIYEKMWHTSKKLG